jgi:hypothetical protein
VLFLAYTVLLPFNCGTASLFDAAQAPAARAPTLLYNKLTFENKQKLAQGVAILFLFDFCMIELVENMNVKSKKLLQFVPFLIIHL